MKCNEIISGFEINRIREIHELNGVLYEMQHIKTGAELVWLKRPDQNKMFSIAFKTLPQDDTGVFHILEHSVLCGSKRFKAKEPFVELLKSSMQTFLNAMTYPDKTIYPISSRNETDFMNLMTVYLDAVFNPVIYNIKNIFLQEGWHYELHSEQEEPIYKGVVLNEMKGAYSSVDSVMMAGMNRQLFKDNCYGFESGGNPDHIPELTYEQYLDSHRKYYHPTNARIFLDGDIPIEKALSLIDSEYLSHYDKKVLDFDIMMQVSAPGTETVQYYEIAPSDEPEGKTQFAMGKIVSSWAEKERNFAIWVLCDYLAGSNDAPLKKAILQNKLGKDVYLRFMDEIAQPYLWIEVRNTDYSLREQIKSTLRDTIASLVKQGIDAEELTASINRLEFQFREMKEPKGIALNSNALKSWLYGGDPAMYLTFADTFHVLREKAQNGYFEQLIANVLLEETDMTTICTLPSSTLGEEKRNAEIQKLASAKASWDTESMMCIMEENRNLEAWQRTPDTKEALATLPKLKLTEVAIKPEKQHTEVKEINGVTVLQHSSTAKGITYLNLYFSLAEIKLEELPTVALLTGLLGKLPTRKHDVQTLQREIKTHLGELFFDIDIFTESNESEMCKPVFVVRCSVLGKKLEDAVRLICEVLLETEFNHEDRIRDVLLQSEEGFRQAIIMNGHRYAMKRVSSHHSAEATAREYVGGYACYDWIRNFAKDFDMHKDTFIKIASFVQTNIFRKSGLTIGITGEAMSTCIEELIQGFPTSQEKTVGLAHYESKGSCKEGILIPAGISYIAMGANLNQCDTKYSGVFKVLAKILSFDYLWNEVRVQGGAYGAGLAVNENGNVAYYSYRDPDVARSLNIYRKSAEYLRTFCQGEEELDKLIISSVSDTEPLLSPKDSGIAADANYFKNNTYENQCMIRNEILNTKKADLLSLCDAIEQIAEKDCVCVIGHSDALVSCEKEGLTIMNI